MGGGVAISVLKLFESNYFVHILPNVRSISNSSPPIPPSIRDYMSTVNIVVVVLVAYVCLTPRISWLVITLDMRATEIQQ